MSPVVSARVKPTRQMARTPWIIWSGSRARERDVRHAKVKRRCSIIVDVAGAALSSNG